MSEGVERAGTARKSKSFRNRSRGQQASGKAVKRGTQACALGHQALFSQVQAQNKHSRRREA